MPFKMNVAGYREDSTSEMDLGKKLKCERPFGHRAWLPLKIETSRRESTAQTCVGSGLQEQTVGKK